MLVRRLVVPAACAIALLAYSPAFAQSVFAPSGETPTTNTPIDPSPDTPSNSTIFAPPVNQAPATRTPQNNTPRAEAPRGSAQRPVPPSQRDEFAYRTLGLEVPSSTTKPTDPLAGFTPEQIDTARRGFAAMEADNPQMIARNPFRTIDAMNATQKAQDAMMARAKTACDVQSFNILVSPQSFMKDPASIEGLNKNGVPMIGNIIQDLCSNRDMRAKITNSLPMLTIVQRANAPTSVIMTDGIITLTSDFTSEEQPQMSQVKAAFAQAVEETDKFMQGDHPEP